MINITREYTTAVVKKQEDGLSDIVTSVYCICYGTDADTGIFESAGEDIIMNPPQSVNFIQFSDLTKDIVDSWVVSKEQYIALENKIIEGINSRINAIYENKPLPFAENQNP